MKSVMDFFVNNWGEILKIIGGMTTAATVIVKLTPTQKDDNFLKYLIKVMSAFSWCNEDGTFIQKEKWVKNKNNKKILKILKSKESRKIKILKILRVLLKVFIKNIKKRKIKLILKALNFYLKIEILKDKKFFTRIKKVIKILKIIYELKKGKYNFSESLYKDLKKETKKIFPRIKFVNKLYFPMTNETKKLKFGLVFRFRF